MEETSGGGVIEGSGGTLEATAEAVEAEQAMTTKTTSKKNELKSSSQVLL